MQMVMALTKVQGLLDFFYRKSLLANVIQILRMCARIYGKLSFTLKRAKCVLNCFYHYKSVSTWLPRYILHIIYAIDV